MGRRRVPCSFLKRLILDEPDVDVDVGATGERSGIASTLVDDETNVGVDIWLGEIRFRDVLPLESDRLRLDFEAEPFKASIAAVVLRSTSRSSSASSSAVWGSLGVDGLRACV